MQKFPKNVTEVKFLRKRLVVDDDKNHFAFDRCKLS